MAAWAPAQSAAGYSEYYIPGSEDAMSFALRMFGTGAPASNNMHALIAITAWSDNIIVYYDHWENGITFDPDNPGATADETFTLATMGTLLTLDNTPSGGIPIPRSTSATYYDGGDHLFVAGGTVTVTRMSYLEERGRPVQAVAWEIYPVKPQLTTYVLPFGENLSGTMPDFLRTFVLIQATANGTTFSVDLDGNGSADNLDQNYDGDTTDPGDTSSVTLNAGESFFIGNINTARLTPTPVGARATINSRAVIQGSSTLQVKFVIGDPGVNYETRGLSAFPRGYWTKDYYAPVGEPANTSITDIFLFNPTAASITVSYETMTGSGSFPIGAVSTVSYRTAVGSLPTGSGVYLKGSDVFWGVSTVDSTGPTYEWAYSLLPTTLLYSEHFLGWAQGGADGNDSGVFLTVVQDSTTVFVDTDNDGTPDQTYTLDRLQTQYITDTDGDLSGARIWATGPFTLAFGQNPDTAPTQAASGDLGYVGIPGTDFISLVLTVDKAVNPVVVPTTTPSESEFTLTVSSQKYTVDDIEVVDDLAPGWSFVNNSATITLADLTTITGTAANPTITGTGPYTLTWPATLLGDMAENQQIVIKYTASNTGLASGTLSQNRVRASGSRTIGSPAVTQSFYATDFAYNVSGSFTITKDTSPTTPVYPGDTITYTVTVNNPSGTVALSGLTLYDALPAGVTMVPGATTLSRSTVADSFGSQAYNLNAGTRSWTGDWTETRDDASATTGRVIATGTQLRLNDNPAQNLVAQDSFDTNGSYAGFNGTNNWAGSWAEWLDDGSASTGAILVAGNQLRINDYFNVVDSFATNGSYTGSNGVRSWSAGWSETNDDASASTGAIVVAGNQLRLSGRYAADFFSTNGSYAGSNGNTAWAGSWVESDSAGGSQRADQGSVRVAGDVLRLNNDAAVTTQSATRSVTLTGTGATQATVYFTCGSDGAEAGDTAVVQYALNGSGSFTTLETYTDGVCASPRTITIPSFPDTTTSLEIRFAILSAAAYTDTYANERFWADNVSVAWNQEPSAARGVDLSSFTGLSQATLAFTCGTSNAEAGDTAVVRYRLGGSGAFTTLATFSNGTCTSPQNLTIPIASPALLEVQFAIPTSPGYTQDNGTAEYFWVDGVTVTWAPQAWVQRGVDLTGSGATSASLQFACGDRNADAGDSAVVQYRLGGSGGWTTLGTYSGATPCPVSPYTVAVPIASPPNLTEIRFTVPNATSYVDAGEYFIVDTVIFTATGVTPAIARSVDLTATGATNAILTFDYSTSGTLEATDDIAVEQRTGGSGAWTTLATYTDDGNGTAKLPLTLASPADLTEVRFAFPAATDYAETGEYFYVDNLSITYDQSATGDDAPSLLQGSYLYTLAAGQGLTATFQVTVDDPFPTGLDTVTNVASATSNELPIAIHDDASNDVIVPMVLSSSVGDRVWLDVDGDGVQDIGEPGLANVEVTLKDQFGTPVAVAVTDSTGRFLFTDVAPGTGYYIEVTDGLPAGLTQSYPSGHADNRTDAFNLVDGQVDRTRDLGFRAATGTATFGDRVWVDADSDQFQDPGEIGLGGVTVTLYLDNGDGVLGAGDTQVGVPVTTAPDGSYLFTGVAASGTETYFVAATQPAGYAATGATTYRFQTVAAGSTLVTADFGFVGDTVTTYSIQDRVWADLDGSGTVNGGETGIAGVTVELLDGSGNVIGTTTTASDGTFSFSGLAGGGADYTVRISDTGGVLADFAGTTPYATAGERAEDNLSGNKDYTAAPSYGFRPLRAIGDLLYYDVSNFGVWDTGEPGIAGVEVSLFRDLDSDGVVDSTVPCPNGANDCLLGTVTSSASGGYLFSGLSNGDYIVSVPVQTGYTFRGPGSDSDATRPGIQKAVALSGPNQLDIDFGYSADAARAISGRVWNDLDADGVTDPGEGGYEGVTLEILSGGVVVATVTTDPTGTYSISGLAAGTYTVRLTDTASILVGLLETYEMTESTAGPFNYQEVVDLLSSDATGVSFGFHKPGPTYASVVGVRAGVSGRGVVVEWRTTNESGTLGFNVLRGDPLTGSVRQVNERLLPGLLVRPEGGVYRFLDKGAPLGTALSYTFEEVAVGGTRRTSGPYLVRPSTDVVLDAGERGWVRDPAALSDEQVRRLGILEQERVAAASRKASLTGPVLKITTGQAGLTYLPTTELAARLARPEPEVAALLRSRSLALSTRGQLVPYLLAPGEDGLYFFAEPSPTIYSSENVYWLTGEPGVLMGDVPSPYSVPRVVTAFSETLHAEQEQYPLPRYFSDPESDFWCWDDLVAGYAGLDRKSFTVPVRGVFNLSSATLTVHLQGGSDTAASVDHHVLVSWNGVAVGEARWDGTLPYQLVIPLGRGAVLEGTNTLELVAVLDPGVDFSVVYLDSLDLTYDRMYRAADDELTFSAPGNAEVIVPGFTSSSIVVLDVTGPARPAKVKATVGPAADGSYQVRFGTPASKVSRRYLATATSVARAPVAVTAFQSAGLADPSNRADYLLIAPPSLVDSAEALAQYRSAQGIDARVVDLESVYDEFNYGLPSPWAIQGFLHHAATAWDGPPTAATLVGRGTYDYMNRNGMGDNLVPPLLAATPYGLTVSDTRIADWTGDEAPELALGRLPFVTSQEVADYLAKIEVYEAAAADPLRVLLAADNPDASGSFTADSNAVSAFVPPGFQVDKVYLATYNPEDGRQAILGAVNAGVLLFNYIGHGGLDHLADEVLLDSADVAAMTNATRLPVFLGMTCSVGNFGIPGFPSLGETMLQRTGGGALAVWAASGLSDNAEAVELNKAFFRAVFVDGERGVGQIVFKALHSPEAQVAPGFMKEIYNLLGEPVSALP